MLIPIPCVHVVTVSRCVDSEVVDVVVYAVVVSFVLFFVFLLLFILSLVPLQLTFSEQVNAFSVSYTIFSCLPLTF